MADEKNDKTAGEGGVYKIDTVPPPAGEDDAYSAPTKVGPMGDAFVKNLMKDAEQRTAELTRKQEEAAPASKAPISKAPASADAPPVSKPPVSAGGTPLPRIYDEEEDEAATVLSPKAKPPSMPRVPSALKVPTEGTPAAPPFGAPPPVLPPSAPMDPMAPPPSWSAGAPLPPQMPIPEPVPFAPRKPTLDRRAIITGVSGLVIFLIGLAMLLATRR